MDTHIRWTIPPFKKHVRVITAGIDAFFETNGFSHEDSLRMQLGFEGVFVYCVATIWKAKDLEEIEVALSTKDNTIIISLRHQGPSGEWDEELAGQVERPIRRTSFESMGLVISQKMLDSLVYENQYDLSNGEQYHKYILKYRPQTD